MTVMSTFTRATCRYAFLTEGRSWSRSGAGTGRDDFPRLHHLLLVWSMLAAQVTATRIHNI